MNLYLVRWINQHGFPTLYEHYAETPEAAAVGVARRCTDEPESCRFEVRPIEPGEYTCYRVRHVLDAEELPALEVTDV
jgi:hypothetical protein